MAWPATADDRATLTWSDTPTESASCRGTARTVTAPRRLRELVQTTLQTAALALVFSIGLRQVAQPRVVDGSSMEPTLHTGQRVLISPLAYHVFWHPERGQIVVFDSWGDGEDYIKRLIGLPGDRVAISGGRVYVNDEPIAEPYVAAAAIGDAAPVTLGKDEYYVLGDNRPNSADSRYYGPLPADRLVGPAFVSLWPPGLLDHASR